MLRYRTFSLMKQCLASMKGTNSFGQAKAELSKLEAKAANLDDKSFFQAVQSWFSTFTNVPLELRFS